MTDEVKNIKEGTTSPITIQVLADGEAIDLSTASYVRVSMIDNLKAVYRYNSNDSPAYVEITTPTTGIITFTPPSEAIFRYNKSPYRMVIWVYAADGTRYACPEEGYNEIIVEPEY